MAMCGSGLRIAGTIPTTVIRVTAARDHPEIAVAGSFAAAPGSTIRGSSARPSEARISPPTEPVSSASGSGGLLRPKHLPPYNDNGLKIIADETEKWAKVVREKYADLRFDKVPLRDPNRPSSLKGEMTRTLKVRRTR
jgi:hypothetical protein